ncbi:hypothetical protein LTR40_009808 [Exophiala xenobiotica]|nr:hypothetical protein LTR40_009808 [Exophiala xenobiotica]
MFALGNQGGSTVEEAWHAVKSALWLFSQLASNNNALAQKCAGILEEFIEGQSPCSVDSTYDECQVSQPVRNSTAESAVAPSEWEILEVATVGQYR